MACVTRVTVAAQLMLMAAPACAQTTDDPFSTPVGAGHRAIEVGIVEFASVPDSDGQPARMMLLVDEPGTGRMFVSDMRGLLYHVSYDGQTVTRYLDLDAATWGRARRSVPE